MQCSGEESTATRFAEDQQLREAKSFRAHVQLSCSYPACAEQVAWPHPPSRAVVFKPVPVYAPWYQFPHSVHWSPPPTASSTAAGVARQKRSVVAASAKLRSEAH
jgi:hypothetical protein